MYGMCAGKGLYCAKVLLGVERGAEWGLQATTALRREQYVVSSEDNRFKVRPHPPLHLANFL
jgi:hypothetical protein